MTNEEAKRILLSDADFSGVGEKAQATAEALCVAIESLEKADKYRWHDLRKNPEDLPTCDGDYMCRVGSRKYPERPMTYEPWDLGAEGKNKWRDFQGYVYDHFVIAWREIEPFEEEE